METNRPWITVLRTWWQAKRVGGAWLCGRCYNEVSFFQQVSPTYIAACLHCDEDRFTFEMVLVGHKEFFEVARKEIESEKK